MRQQRLLDRLVRRVVPPDGDASLDSLVSREWLLTNGLGGYASSTLASMNTRRYHGLLVSALPNPLGRTVMLNRLTEEVTAPDGISIRLDGEERLDSGLQAADVARLAEFRLEAGLPVWQYSIGGGTLERRVTMVHGQNTTHVLYRLEGAEPVRLDLRPAVHFRSYEGSVSGQAAELYQLSAEEHQVAVTLNDLLPSLRMFVDGQDAAFVLRGETIDNIVYRAERDRGYDFVGSLWTPGYFSVLLTSERPVAFVASSEPWETVKVLPTDIAFRLELERRRRILVNVPVATTPDAAAELVLAADQFIISPVGRLTDATYARAVGDEVKTVIAGYHWFTDWGRDTMISLEGLTLTTGRHREAGFILRTFARYVRNGLIPNMFPDGSNEGLYHTADATLWFFHAIDRYLDSTEDSDTLTLILSTLRDIVDHHLRGTRFGIAVDPIDGLLRQGAEGYQLTWMDAKVDDWVVTPRRGKAVELNALWYNALKLLEGWMRERGAEDDATTLGCHADRARRSFNERFWYESGGYLYDVIDGPDGDSRELRPNQLFSFTLRHPVLDQPRWKSVLDVVGGTLLTPVGLRTLAPDSANYHRTYHGDLRTRDAAYHQGTVWPWLIGPWIDAYLRVHPDDRTGARRFLDGLLASLDGCGVGTLPEIFDAEPPTMPRGCMAQAWSVAETLRALDKVSR